jgi:hypothetical protein
MNYNLSTQAIGAIMMALQQSLLEQSDIVPVIQGFEIQVDDSGQLVVMNPPVVKSSSAETSEVDESHQRLMNLTR